jgi:hypothetical protein
VAATATVDGGFVRDLLVLGGFVLAAIVGAAATLRRQTA